MPDIHHPVIPADVGIQSALVLDPGVCRGDD
jgi:hypothetical protein